MHCSRIELDKSYSKTALLALLFLVAVLLAAKFLDLGVLGARVPPAGFLVSVDSVESAESLVAEATAQQKMIKERQEMIDEQQEMDKKLQDMINEQQKMIDEQQKMIVEQQKMFVERQEMIDDRLERPPCLPDYFPAWLALVAPVLQE
ncbi:hypothetical protein BLNAU_8604 [Blattamonas nauphoetae]|uniref:Uncharacterized protein n=1 Tax=Blattamonas nauphoetae TaxID=2049346 RepID=A0ABQ9XY06_9EUKA|nr:hypothetical protein BLNAU_8604 [Blattamonas nauphoetae]